MLFRVVIVASGLEVSLYPLLQGNSRIAAGIAFVVGCPVADRGSMREQLLYRDRHVGVLRVPDRPGQIGVDIGIQVEAPLFPQLHDGRSGKGLGDGTDIEQGAFAHRLVLIEIGMAVGLHPPDRSILDDRAGQSRNVVFCDEGFDKLIKGICRVFLGKSRAGDYDPGKK